MWVGDFLLCRTKLEIHDTSQVSLSAAFEWRQAAGDVLVSLRKGKWNKILFSKINIMVQRSNLFSLSPAPWTAFYCPTPHSDVNSQTQATRSPQHLPAFWFYLSSFLQGLIISIDTRAVYDFFLWSTLIFNFFEYCIKPIFIGSWFPNTHNSLAFMLEPWVM